MMKKPYLERLQEGVLLFDGAMGTYLFNQGIYLKKCFEEVCLSQPQMVLNIHKEYLQAGAQALETNTYGANPIKLRSYNLAHKTEAINKKAVEIAQEAASLVEDPVYIAGAVGPTGQKLEPEGSLSLKEARNSYELHIGTLLRAGVDVLLLETFTDRTELELAIEVVQRIDSSVPLQVQFTASHRLLSDQDFFQRQAMKWGRYFQANEAIDVVGVNLMGPTDALEALRALKQTTTKPIVMMPDAGYPKEVDGRQFYVTDPDHFASHAKLYLDGGASVIGGCCGTTPRHIQEMGQAVLNFDQGRRNIFLTDQVEVSNPVEASSLASRSRLGADLAGGHWVATVELVSPIGTDLSKVLAKAKALEEAGVRYINIPDGPRASARISALVTAMDIQRHTSIEPIFHMCTRDKNLIGLQSDLLASEAVGLKNILMITGDPPKVGKYPSVTGVFDVDSVGLLKLGSRLNQGMDLAGDPLPQATNLVPGTGVNPMFPVPEKELERAWAKAEAGAEYFITQPVYDPKTLGPFLEKLAEIKLPIILGMWPLASYRNALFLNNEVPGVVIPEIVLRRMEGIQDKESARQEGVAISLEILKEFKSFVGGIQVSPPFTTSQPLSKWSKELNHVCNYRRCSPGDFLGGIPLASGPV
jgi:methionine synthase I (cobalamin-dependent)/5,10-methylenetetrahydrofolate reductase